MFGRPAAGLRSREGASRAARRGAAQEMYAAANTRARELDDQLESIVAFLHENKSVLVWVGVDGWMDGSVGGWVCTGRRTDNELRALNGASSYPKRAGALTGFRFGLQIPRLCI